MAKQTNRPKMQREDTNTNAAAMPGKNLLNVTPTKTTQILIMAAIAIITWLFLQPCLDNQISTWDDVPYIRDNTFIKNTSWDGIRNIFSNPVMGNYHPLTIISYAIEYSTVNLEPWLYHFDSLLLHVLTTLLVYWFVFLLSGRAIAAVIAAILFGVHPMHVESVAWVAARKDVLYGAFYVAACIGHVYYLRTVGAKKTLWYAGVLVLFIFALLSKPVAVTLPLALLLIDHFERESIARTAILEKTPHFVLALIFGIIAIKVQHTAGAMDLQQVHYNVIERLALGCYAFTTYLWKAILPAELHCFYPYPGKVNGSIPYLYYLYPVVTGIILFATWRYGRKNKVVMFGSFFFIANILLLLQFLPVGEAIVAERYSYIPYIGLFFIAGWYFSTMFESGVSKLVRYAAMVIGAMAIFGLGYTASDRCRVWYDDTSLWRDEIEKEPVRAVQAYNNLGYIYCGMWGATANPDEKNAYYDSAYYLINKAITLQPDYVNPYLALGELQRSAGKYDEAKQTYYRGISFKSKETDLYVGLAILYVVTKNTDSAGYYFRKVLEIRPNAEAHGNYANLLALEGKDDSAIAEYGKAIALTRTNHVPYMNRGIVLKKHDRWPEARRDLEAAIKINPEAGEAYYNLSFCDTQLQDISKALADIEKARSVGFNGVDTAYYNLLMARRPLHQ